MKYTVYFELSLETLLQRRGREKRKKKGMVIVRLPATVWEGGRGGRREGVLLVYLLNISQEVVARCKGLH